MVSVDKKMVLILDDWRKAIPFGRCREAMEVAKGTVLFAPDVASYITGSDLVIDGDSTAGFY